MKDKKITNYLSIVYAIIVMITITSCELIGLDEALEMKTPEPEIVIDPQIEEEITIEAIEPEEEKVMELKPIAEYEKYAVDESMKVFGLKGKEKIPVILNDTDGKEYQFNDFFVKDGTMFFNTIVMENGTEKIPDSDPVQYVQVPKTYYYFQTGNVITKDTKSSYPSKPISKRVEMGITPYSIVSGKYGDIDISTIKQVIKEGMNPVTNFLFIDGYFSNNDGLWFSVPEGVENTAVKKGLYNWALGSNRIDNKGEYCRIW